MMFLFTILFIVSYVVIGVFGVFGMHAQAEMNTLGHEMSFGNCVAVATRGVSCPIQTDPISFAIFHADAFRWFAFATFSENFFTSLFTPTLLFVWIGFSVLSSQYLALPRFHLAYSKRRSEQFRLFPKQRFLRWLALHENSPAIF